MHVAAFVAKWRQSTLKERSAAQSHFNDLCAVLGVPSPTEADPASTFYAFERGAKKSEGGDGWADVHACALSQPAFRIAQRAAAGARRHPASVSCGPAEGRSAQAARSCPVADPDGPRVSLPHHRDRR